jgi:uncharacterized membrane protein
MAFGKQKKTTETKTETVNNPITLLKLRYASGEISQEELTEKLEVLQHVDIQETLF